MPIPIQKYLQTNFQLLDWKQFPFLSATTIGDFDFKHLGPHSFQFFLLLKALNDSEERDCFHFQLPSREAQSDILQATLLSVVLTHYYLNLATTEEYNGLPKTGTVVYSRGRRDFLRFCGTSGDCFWFEPVLERKQDSELKVEVKKSNFWKYPNLPSAEDFPYNRNSVKHLEEFFRFFQEYLPSFEPLFHFSKKCLLIAPPEIVTCLNFSMPIRYNGSKHYQVPAEPLVEIVNDFEAGRHILKENTFHSLIVLGGSRYNSNLDKMRDAFDEGLFQKLIVVGEAEVSSSFGFKKWRWTEPEWRTLTNLEPCPILPTLPLVDLAVENFKRQFDKLKAAFISWNVNPSTLTEMGRRFLQYFSRLALPGVQSNAHQFFEQQFLENHWLEIAFREAGADDAFSMFCEELRILLDAFSQTFENQKLKYILSQSGQGEEFFIVTEKWQADLLNPIFEEHNKHNHKAISPGELKRLLREDLPSKNKAKKTHFIFLYLHFRPIHPTYYLELYRRALDFGDAILLYYDGIENQRIEALNAFSEKWNHNWMEDADRDWFMPKPFRDFVKFDFVQETKAEASETVMVIEALQSLADEEEDKILQSIKDYFNQRFGILDDFEKPGSERTLTGIFETQKEGGPENDNVENTTVRLNRKWLIVFDDDSSKDWYEDIVIAKIGSDGKFAPIRVPDLCSGDRVAADFDIRFDNSFEALKTIPDLRPFFKEIRWASKEWRLWLNNMLEVYKTKHGGREHAAWQEFYKKLDVSVAESQVKTWLTSREEYYFPKKIEDFEKVLVLRLKKTPPGHLEQVKQEAERIKRSRDLSASFREEMTQLSHELSTFLATKQKGKYLANIPQPHIEAMLRYKELKTVKSVTKKES